MTVVHLIKVNSAKVTTARVSLSSSENKGKTLVKMFDDSTNYIIMNVMYVCMQGVCMHTVAIVRH